MVIGRTALDQLKEFCAVAFDAPSSPPGDGAAPEVNPHAGLRRTLSPTRHPDALERWAISLAKNTMPEPNSGCVLWCGTVNVDGYGKIVSTVQGRRAEVSAHRASYEIHKGEIPAGLHVCHKCDVRSCVNPDHLFLGTIAENTADMVAKGRTAKGEKNARAKLTEAQAREILAADGPHDDIARRFGISRGGVSQIKTGRKWRHLHSAVTR